MHLKTLKMIATSDFLTALECTKFVFGPGPRWGSSRRSPRPPSRLGRRIPPPHSPPHRRLRRLGLVAYGDSTSRLRRSIVDPPAVVISPPMLGGLDKTLLGYDTARRSYENPLISHCMTDATTTRVACLVMLSKLEK